MAMYANSKICYDKWPLTPSRIYIKLALVKKERTNRAEADKFTRLTLRGEIDQILKVKQPIEIDDIFNKEDMSHLIIVEGAPGIGKSTFAWELCREWPARESLKQFSLVVFNRLREKQVQNATTLNELLYHKNDELRSNVRKTVEEQEGENVLFIFDGFDEFPASCYHRSLVMDLICGTYLPKATIVVTSRPSATRELINICRRTVDKHIEVVGFSDKEISEYAESVLESTPKILSSFFTYLSINPVVKGMMYNPLNSAIILEVYRETFTSGKPIPHTLTELYTEVSLYLLSRHLDAKGDPIARNLPCKLDYISQKSPNLYEQLKTLGKVAYEERVSESIVFHQLPENCSDLGLLNAVIDVYGRRQNVTYNFLHLTLQDYMGAFYISQQPTPEQSECFVKTYGLKHMKMVWKFVAGLTKMCGLGWDCIKEGKWESHQNESKWEEEEADRGYAVKGSIIEIGPSLLQCLYETQDSDSCRSVFGSSVIKYCGYVSSSVFDAYCVGYCIALSKNTWNVDLHMNSLGPELLEMLVCGMKSLKCGGRLKWLDLSNNALKNEGIMHFHSLPTAFQHLQTLNVSKCQLGREGLNHLAHAINFCPHLIILKVNGNSCGNGGAVKLFEALVQHGKLLDLDVFEMGIGSDDVKALSELIHEQGELKQLRIGEYDMSQDCMKQLLTTILSPSSIQELRIAVPYFLSPMSHLPHTLSDNLLTLGFFTTISPPASNQLMQNTKESVDDKCNKYIWDILKENETLESLMLDIPLDKPSIMNILNSLEENDTLAELWLSEHHHFNFFSQSERQELDDRITWWY